MKKSIIISLLILTILLISCQPTKTFDDFKIRDYTTQVGRPIREGEMSLLDCRTRTLEELGKVCSRSEMNAIELILNPKTVPMGGTNEKLCNNLKDNLFQKHCKGKASPPKKPPEQSVSLNQCFQQMKTQLTTNCPNIRNKINDIIPTGKDNVRVSMEECKSKSKELIQYYCQTNPRGNPPDPRDLPPIPPEEETPPPEDPPEEETPPPDEPPEEEEEEETPPPEDPPETIADCPAGSIEINPGEDIASIINDASSGTTFCISGKHRTDETIEVKEGQTLLGITSDATISGAKELTGWTKEESGVWSYSGSLATRKNIAETFGGNDVDSCFEVTIYQDDVFYLPPGGSAKDDTRMMRVLSLNQLKGTESLPEGQAETDGEFGRFFFDYDNDKIYINQDPTGATVDLAYVGTLIQGEEDHVTLQNLVLEKTRDFIVDAIIGKDPIKGKAWVIDGVTIRFAHGTGYAFAGGLSSSDPGIIRDSLVTNNGQYGMGGNGVWYEIDNVELSWNNIANHRRLKDGECRGYWGAGSAKFAVVYGGDENTPSMHVNKLNSHHNLGDGFWSDVVNQYILIENSEFHENERSGYVMEISCNIEVRNNEFWGNGLFIKNDMLGVGMGLTNANYAYVHDNTFTDNKDFEITLSYAASGHENHFSPCFDVTDPYDGTDSLRDNLFENNVIKMCTSKTGTRSRVALDSRNNFFKGNTYYVPDVNGKWWDAGTGKDLTWAEWQAEGQDETGSVQSYTC